MPSFSHCFLKRFRVDSVNSFRKHGINLFAAHTAETEIAFRRFQAYGAAEDGKTAKSAGIRRRHYPAGEGVFRVFFNRPIDNRDDGSEAAAEPVLRERIY